MSAAVRCVLESERKAVNEGEVLLQLTQAAQAAAKGWTDFKSVQCLVGGGRKNFVLGCLVVWGCLADGRAGCCAGLHSRAQHSAA